MQLSHLIYPSETVSGTIPSIAVRKPCMDTRILAPNDVFYADDPHRIAEAVKKGACAVIAHDSYQPCDLPTVPLLRVKNVRRQYALAWSRMMGDPARDLRIVAVTGTNGKTSVTSMLCDLLRALGYTTGLIGTAVCSDGIHTVSSDYTTPPPEILYPLLRKTKDNGAEFAVMEASSHALSQERMAGICPEIAVFTNLTRDHLDYHGTKDAYFAAKALLFKNAKKALIFDRDPASRRIAREAVGDVFYYGENPLSEFYVKCPTYDADGIRYTLVFNEKETEVKLPLHGEFHIGNSAAALACAMLLGVGAESLPSAIQAMHTPAGRMERLPTNTPYTIYLDYAHSPDALHLALRSLRPLCKRLTVLFGAGGERDTGKRPQMGGIASRIADRVILTSDNPRGEDPEKILAEIISGIPCTDGVIRIPDRTEAIIYALDTAQTDEILLFAGKGNETYLIDENGKHPFSEREIIRKYLERKGYQYVFQHSGERAQS